MPGFLKANLSVVQAQALLPKFNSVSVDELLANSTLPRLNRVTLTYLYASQPVRKIQFTKSGKNVSNSRKIKIEKYHRFVVFGVPGTSTVLAMFSSNSEETRRLFRYHCALKPGSQVEVIKPTVEGTLSRGGTSLISTKEPLVPSPTQSAALTLPPYDVEGSCSEFKFFSFVTKNLEVDSAVVAEDVCNGDICDSQTFHDSCGCLEASQNKGWVLLLEFTCPEINAVLGNSDLLQIYSNTSTAVFVSETVKCLKADSDAIDRFNLDTSVQAMVTKINSGGGFRVVGWFKPALDEDGTTIEHKRFHICSLLPEKPVTNEEAQLKYKGEGAPVATTGGTADETTSTPQQNNDR